MEKHNKKSDSKSFIPRTPLAQRLWEWRQAVLASHVSLLTLDEIRQEVQERRGGALNEEKA